MDRRTRTRMVRWMTDHFIHYTNARELAAACAAALALPAAGDQGCLVAALYTLACDYYPQERHCRASPASA
jgi:hypothetical protein